MLGHSPRPPHLRHRLTANAMSQYRHTMTRQKRKQAHSRQGMTVTTVALPDEMHRRLLIAAVETNTAATEIVRQALADWLSRHQRKKG